MAANPKHLAPRALVAAALIGALAALLWAFPLFRVVPLRPSAHGRSAPAASDPVTFDAAATAARIWAQDLPAAARHAADLRTLALEIQRDPAAARRTRAKAAGVGAAYYFVRGSGRVTTRDRNYLRLAVDGAEPATVALRIGPVFGNTVRDGCGVLDVNAFPGLQEFNALAAELNALVEKNVLPLLRNRAAVGAVVQFAGCAEAPETVGGPGEPLLTLVPVQAEVR